MNLYDSKYLKEYATFSNESGQRSKRVTINYKMYQYNILCWQFIDMIQMNFLKMD